MGKTSGGGGVFPRYPRRGGLREVERWRSNSGFPALGEMVLASAGTGKTYALSSQMLALLAHGVGPHTILASTFTRKAAGEILERVLGRLAEAVLDSGKARELAQAVRGDAATEGEEGGGDPFPAPQVLQSVLENLHRLQVGTLDSFFVRLGRCCPAELGLPLNWRLGDPSTLERLEEEAVQRVLGGADRQAVAEVVRAAFGGREVRGVHLRLTEELRGLRSLLREARLAGWDGQTGLSLPLEQGKSSGSPAEALAAVLAALERAEVPLTKKGTPNQRFKDAVVKAAEALRRRDWAAFCDGRLVEAVLSGERAFSGVPVPPPLVEAVEMAIKWARGQVGAELARRGEALVQVGRAFDEALEELQAREGVYGFEDITYRVAKLSAGGLPSDLWYRLDGTVHHVLLDEFQDTSVFQWQALRPLAEEILAAPQASRSLLLVADPKQSIYGWRGGEPALAARIALRYGLGQRSLNRSFRTGTPILEVVNRVFEDLPSNPVWEGVPDLRSAVELWSAAFGRHEGRQDRPGYVQWEMGPGLDGEEANLEGYLTWVAQKIRDVRNAAPGANLGVLVRKNRTAAYLAFRLRAMGVEVSEEGGAFLTDSPAVSTVLALLHLADHPGDSVARFQVALSPLGPLVGLDRWDDEDLACQVAWGIRRDLLHGGYGPTLHGWWRGLREGGGLNPQEEERFLQLVELGYRWDEQRTLRCQEFTRFVEAETRETPSTAPLRVMTVHRAKGLEFDAVVVPDLHEKLLLRGRGPGGALALRDRRTGDLLGIVPRPAKAVLGLLPPCFSEAVRQEQERELLDALGVLYVALTRAKYALYLLSPRQEEDVVRGTSVPTYQSLLRGPLEVSLSSEPGSVVFRHGDPQWSRALPEEQVGEYGRQEVGAQPSPRLQLKPPPSRQRHLPLRTPTDPAWGSPTPLARLLAMDSRRERARAVGDIVHAWLAELEWLEDWMPSDDELLSLAHRAAPTLPPAELRALLGRFRDWLGQPEIRALLERGSQPEAENLQVERETPFLVRLGGTLVRGRIDRLVLGKGPCGVHWAHLVDFKTDEPSNAAEGGLEEELRRHAPQLAAYREAVSVLYGLSPGRVRTLLALLPRGRVVEIPAGS